jgi:hypothetical protein
VSDLRYSLELLHGLGRELQGLADALDGTAQRTAWDAEDVGHRRVAAALHGFADSWDDRRQLLTAKLQDVSGMAERSAATFQQVDDQLAADVRAIWESR